MVGRRKASKEIPPVTVGEKYILQLRKLIEEDKELWQCFLNTIAINKDIQTNLERLLIAASHDNKVNDATEAEVQVALKTMHSALALRRDKLGCRGAMTDQKMFSDDFVATFQSTGVLGVAGHDSEYRPIIYLGLGKFQIPEFKRLWEDGVVGDPKEFERNLVTLWYVHMMDWLMQVSLPDKARRKGHTVTQVSLIIDVQGIGWSLCTSDLMSWLKGVSRLGNVFFGEMLHQVYIVNVPWMAAKMWSIAQRFLHPLTVQKFHLWSPKDTPKLLETLPMEAVPTSVGGSFPEKDLERNFDYSRATKTLLTKSNEIFENGTNGNHTKGSYTNGRGSDGKMLSAFHGNVNGHANGSCNEEDWSWGSEQDIPDENMAQLEIRTSWSSLLSPLDKKHLPAVGTSNSIFSLKTTAS